MATPTIAIIPSIFKPGVLGSVLPIGGEADLTFTRADGAGNGRGTRINKDGLIQTMEANVPRLDYSNGGCPSLLLEPQSTNLITFSEAFDNAYWTKTGATIDNNAGVGYSSPSANNPLGAFKLVEDTSTAVHRLDKTFTISAATDYYSLSVRVKKEEIGALILGLRAVSFSNRAEATFDLTNGVISVPADDSLGNLTNASAKIDLMANGYYNISLSVQKNTDTNLSAYIYLAENITDTIATASYTGDGTSGVYIFGAQLEQLSYASSYIPTAGAIATRLGDTASKAGLSSYIDSTSGVFEVEIAALSNNQTFRSISISNGTTQNTVIIRYSNITQQIQFVVIIGNSIVYFHGETVADIRVSTKCKLKWDLNNFGAKINDVEVDSQLSGAVYPANTLTKVGFTEGTTTFKFEGYVKNIQVHKGISSY
jgi:hypothetical protein